MEVHAIIEYLVLKVNEDSKGIGIKYAWLSIQLLFQKLFHSFDAQRIAVMHEWWEWNPAVVARDQNSRELFEGYCGPQDIFTLEDGN